jgi:TolB-like protein
MAKNPDERYSSARAMADGIQSALQLTDSEMIEPRPMTRPDCAPLRILRSDPETDFLAFSLADAITISFPGLNRCSCAPPSRPLVSGDAPDLQALAGQADVDIVLTGTLLRAGDQLRVNAQLVETPGRVLWSLTSQVPLGDVTGYGRTGATHRGIARAAAFGAGSAPVEARCTATAKACDSIFGPTSSDTIPSSGPSPAILPSVPGRGPSYAPAWARLGRICRVLGMYTERDSQGSSGRPSRHSSARSIDPQLPLAHNLYTSSRTGWRSWAMLRLLEGPGTAGDPELFAGLVQACRYCGLLEDSVAARSEEPAGWIESDVAHSYLMGDYTGYRDQRRGSAHAERAGASARQARRGA